MNNFEEEFGNFIVNENGVKYIKFPMPVLNPYMYKTYKNELAKIIRISRIELYDMVKNGSGGDANDHLTFYGYKLEKLLKENAPQPIVENYIMYKLPIINDECLSVWYRKILRRIERYHKCKFELNAPDVIIYNELCMLQKAVDQLYFGNNENTRYSKEQCLWDIVMKQLNITNDTEFIF